MTTYDPPIVTPTILACVLGCSNASFLKHLVAGKIPPPDVRTSGNCKTWRLSTLRAWNPAVADAAAELVTRKPIPLNTAA